jgi:hypothetical protein
MGDVGAAAMHNSTAADCEQLPTPHGLDTWREHMLLLACIIILVRNKILIRRFSGGASPYPSGLWDFWALG